MSERKVAWEDEAEGGNACGLAVEMRRQKGMAAEGTWHVGGVLAVSRAFGDKLLKPYVVAEPEIQEEEINGVDFIIIASDGLWNVLSNKDAVIIVQDIKDAEAASRKLIQEAFARGSSDNITCVVRFENTRD